MDRNEADEIVGRLYRYMLQRDPGAEEQELWSNIVLQGTPFLEILDAFGESDEYKRRHNTTPYFAPGHYYSPIVSPDEDTRRYMLAQTERVGPVPKEILFDAAGMQAFFTEHAGFMAAATFPTQKGPRHRYYSDNGGFPLGDALVLRAMIRHANPRRIIEVGSGFSTACMLDTLDELGCSVKMTCIDPYPDRLKSLLRPGDAVEIIESPVQDVAVERFAELQSGDILFIDSTHVVKTGSDVHYELFEILPTIAAGVYIHFHDVPYPFDYPLEWVFDQNYSWNEAYFVRAFLMYNKDYSVFYSSSYVMHYARSVVKQYFAGFPTNPGSGLWLLKETSQVTT
jgi:hypothetical protein